MTKLVRDVDEFLLKKGNLSKDLKNMQPFTKRVITIIRSIPLGKVMTYGEIARLAGNSKGARQVARILHTLSEKYDLPWHRVVNRKGEIVIKDDETKFIQISRLETEGIFVNCNGCVDLDKYRCTGENTVIREENDFV